MSFCYLLYLGEISSDSFFVQVENDYADDKHLSSTKNPEKNARVIMHELLSDLQVGGQIPCHHDLNTIH